MKGLVFIAYSRMIEERYGLVVWENILEMCEPTSKGIYTASDNYPITELISMNRYLSRLVERNEKDIYLDFGKYLFQYFCRRYPHLFEGRNLKSTISVVEQIINRDFKKMYPDINAPRFNYEEISEFQSRLIFESEFDLTDLTLGVIEGMACHYKEKYSIHTDTHKKNAIYLNVFNVSFLTKEHIGNLDEVA